MTRAALVLFDDDDPGVSVVGISWPEFRLRSGILAGAMHVVVVGGRITPDLLAAIDRARSNDVSVTLARTAADVADLFHPDETVLLLSGPAIVEDELIARLVAADRSTLLCVGHGTDSAWELIDARARWTGLARLDGAQVRATAAMVGDWDLSSTLLRQAVVAKAKRMMLGEDDTLYRIDRAGDAVQASQRIVAVAVRIDTGWATRRLVTPLARQAGLILHGRLATLAQVWPWSAGALLIAGAVLGWSLWPALAAGMLFLGFVVEALGSLASRATGRRSGFGKWRAWILNAAPGLALAGLVLPPMLDRGPLVLAVMLVVVTAFADRLRDAADDAWWLADVPGYILIVGVAAAFGPVVMMGGLVAALTHALVSLAWLQNRLSRALTRVR